jgi:hypothetical protein
MQHDRQLCDGLCGHFHSSLTPLSSPTTLAASGAAGAADGAEGLISAARVATGIVGVVGTAARGDVDEPVTLASFANARELFGVPDDYRGGGKARGLASWLKKTYPCERLGGGRYH